MDTGVRLEVGRAIVRWLGKDDGEFGFECVKSEVLSRSEEQCVGIPRSCWLPVPPFQKLVLG